MLPPDAEHPVKLGALYVEVLNRRLNARIGQRSLGATFEVVGHRANTKFRFGNVIVQRIGHNAPEKNDANQPQQWSVEESGLWQTGSNYGNPRRMVPLTPELEAKAVTDCRRRDRYEKLEEAAKAITRGLERATDSSLDDRLTEEAIELITKALMKLEIAER